MKYNVVYNRYNYSWYNSYNVYDHPKDKPARLLIDKQRRLYKVYFYKKGYMHRLSGPASIVIFRLKETIIDKDWYIDGKKFISEYEFLREKMRRACV